MAKQADIRRSRKEMVQIPKYFSAKTFAPADQAQGNQEQKAPSPNDEGAEVKRDETDYFFSTGTVAGADGVAAAPGAPAAAAGATTAGALISSNSTSKSSVEFGGIGGFDSSP